MDDRHRLDEAQDDPDVAQLVKLAGLRPAPPTEALDRLRAVTHSEWERVVAARRRRVYGVVTVAGLAAALLLVVRLGPSHDSQSDAPPVFTATLVAATGQVDLIRASGTEQGAALRIGDAVTSSDDINTPGGVVAAFRLAGGASLRVNERTLVRVESPALVTLERGTVYLDTAAAQSDLAIEVRTPLGVIRDIGTQFEVDVTESRTRVRVRDGEVVFTRATSDTRAARATEVVATAEGVTTRTIPVFGPDWAWVGISPSAFDLSSHTLMEFLQWVSRETGYTVSFESQDLAMRAERMRVQGSIDGLTAEEALDAVVPATGLEYHVSNGQVIIRAQ